MAPSAPSDTAAVSSFPTGTASQPNSESFFDDNAEFMNLITPPKFKTVEEEREYLKEKLAASVRIFGKYGYDHHVAGHLTVRDPANNGTFWVNPLALAFSLVTVSDLILVNEEGEVIGGGKPGRRIINKAGFMIHSSIHKARPDVQAICHSHSIYGKAFSTLGKPLTFTTQDSCSFYQDIALLTQFDGVVLSKEEGALIAKTLEDKKAIVLQNHGLLTVGTTIDSAVAWYILLETQCQVQLLAEAACAGTPGSKPKEIEHEDALFTSKQGGSEQAGYLFASPYFQVIEKEQGHEYKQ
ncbi:uncharacterized protein JCM6883_000882 [Sporobolomyces salmoneus]|uniref:uncharacterized protein n=1 Tax=Sporobolomyces salmoneus TaxID=183962 RepID=UPI003170F4D8